MYLYDNPIDKIIIKNKYGKIVCPIDRYNDNEPYEHDLLIQFLFYKQLNHKEYFKLLKDNSEKKNIINLFKNISVGDCFDEKLVSFILREQNCGDILQQMLDNKKYDDLSEIFSLPKSNNQNIIELYNQYIGDIIKDIKK
jgi:hypothetical protein